jgi:hypothetical protein
MCGINKICCRPSVAAMLIVTTLLSHTHTDSGVPRGSQQRTIHRECASRRRNAHRGARGYHRHARETTRKEAVRCTGLFTRHHPELIVCMCNVMCMPQITVARLLGQGDRYQGRGPLRTPSICRRCGWRRWRRRSWLEHADGSGFECVHTRLIPSFFLSFLFFSRPWKTLDC